MEKLGNLGQFDAISSVLMLGNTKLNGFWKKDTFKEKEGEMTGEMMHSSKGRLL